MSPESKSERRWNVWKLNLTALGLACLGGLFLLGYYHFSPTYGGAREAKALYDSGQFEEALKKAQKIYDDNSYNVMAYSVVKQSQKAIRWRRFTIDSQNYAQRLRVIAAQENIDPADMLIAKMTLETAIEDYARLGESDTMWNRALVKEANEYFQEFSALYKKLFNGANR
jgi:tetratricopeptide (TPR) repeat protein